jgi:hypothetical protein
MNRLVQSILVATAGWVTLTGLAQNPPPPGEGGPRPPQREGGPVGRGGRGGMMRSSLLMVALDTNKDGELSAEEIANASKSLRALDKNGDGKDDHGEPVKPGTYTLYLEAAREHGTYQLMKHEFAMGGPLFRIELKGNEEIKSASLEYRRRTASK